jgi:hypothetical protein
MTTKIIKEEIVKSDTDKHHVYVTSDNKIYLVSAADTFDAGPEVMIFDAKTHDLNSVDFSGRGQWRFNSMEDALQFQKEVVKDVDKYLECSGSYTIH